MATAVQKMAHEAGAPMDQAAFRRILLRPDHRRGRNMGKLELTLGCWDYDRVQPLIEGRVRPEGIDLRFLNMVVEETFFRMLRHREFDASEMSMSSYVVSLFAARAAVRGDPGLSLPLLPPLVHLRERRGRHRRAGRPCRQALRLPRIPDDRARSGSAESWPSTTACRWTASPTSPAARRRPTATRSSSSTCRRTSASSASAPRTRWRRCWPTAASTRSTPRASPRPSTGAAWCGSSPITCRSSGPTGSRPASSRSCTSSPSAARSMRRTAGLR